MKRIFPFYPPLTTSIFAALISLVSAASSYRRGGGFFFRRGGAGQLSPAAPLSATLSPDDQVPTIDVAPLFNEDAAAEERRECVDAIGRACERFGFFNMVNHPIDRELMAALKEEMVAFFAQPKHIKMRIKRNSETSRGWFDDELTKQKMDWKEGLDLGKSNGRWEGSTLDGYNQFTESERFNDLLKAYYGQMERIASKLIEALATHMGVADPSSLAPLFAKHSSLLRLNYFPPCPDCDEYLGVSHHTDGCAITLLLQEVPGLQVWLRDKQQWVDVQPVKDALTVNVGDVMQIWSNDRYPAALHRVQANPSRERYSIPFFFSPQYDAIIAPLPAGQQPRYRPFRWGEFRADRIKGDYVDLGEEAQVDRYRRTEA
ncbi:unnamed protein product [Vitrella brassicaformis CCMP3155]|uniref:Fe2OG dioxygenase domain-containing protein n=2 Tax=Vitrella brassicaformis TaxID=1169539 RepID=A0A0G4ETM9_VITBC|nr:unnamed protein product [Vitrella brassicaformis CCMP3155]|eukprot:CEM01019.1 unnamed protein product [Vitrella brassicaformis CCMP3155]